MFPIIHDISDIKPYIDGKEEIQIRDKGIYTVVDYAVQKESTFDSPQSKECRGLKFYPDGQIASRPFAKFFNRGENPNEEPSNENFIMVEKYDGCMIHSFQDKHGNLSMMTKAGYTEFSDAAERWADDKYWRLMRHIEDQNKTAIFEFFGPDCPHNSVVKYEDTGIVLLAVRDKVTGEYFSEDEVQNIAKEFGVPTPHIYTDITADVVKEWVAREGVVLVWPDGYKLKIKSSDYVLKHRTKDSLSQEKNVLALVIKDEVDDLANVLDEDDWKSVQDYYTEVWNGIAETEARILNEHSRLAGLERKEVALGLNLAKNEMSVFWQVYEGKDVRQALCNLILKKCTSQSKVDECRNLFGAEWDAV